MTVVRTARRALPVSAPPRVLERLRRAPDGAVPVLHRSRHAIYVRVGAWCVGVVDPDAARVPCALRLRTAQPIALRGESAYFRQGVLHLDGTPLVVGRVEDVRVLRLDSEGAARMTADSATTMATPPAAVVEFVALLEPTGRIDAPAVARVLGRGEGLTPLGDDLLCGWLATHRAARVATPEVDEAVRHRLGGTTLLSATLLDCALHGEALPEFAAYLSCVGTPAEPAAAAALSSIGHTSGAGLLYGARLALSGLHHQIGAVA